MGGRGAVGTDHQVEHVAQGRAVVLRSIPVKGGADLGGHAGHVGDRDEVEQQRHLAPGDDLTLQGQRLNWAALVGPGKRLLGGCGTFSDESAEFVQAGGAQARRREM